MVTEEQTKNIKSEIKALEENPWKNLTLEGAKRSPLWSSVTITRENGDIKIVSNLIAELTIPKSEMDSPEWSEIRDNPGPEIAEMWRERMGLDVAELAMIVRYKMSEKE